MYNELETVHLIPTKALLHTIKCNSYQLQLQIPEADTQPALHACVKVQSDKLQVLDQAHRPVSQWGGGLGACSPRNVWKLRALRSFLRLVLDQNMVLQKNLTNKLTCMHCSITSQENLVQTCSFGCKSADTSPFSL